MTWPPRRTSEVLGGSVSRFMRNLLRTMGRLSWKGGGETVVYMLGMTVMSSSTIGLLPAVTNTLCCTERLYPVPMESIALTVLHMQVLSDACFQMSRIYALSHVISISR